MIIEFLNNLTINQILNLMTLVVSYCVIRFSFAVLWDIAMGR